MKFVAEGLAVVALGLGAAQPNDARPIAALAWLVGDWRTSATETATDDSSFRETGFTHCEWVLGERAIRCEAWVHRDEAKGRYDNDTTTRTSIRYFTLARDRSEVDVVTIHANGGASTHAFSVNEAENELRNERRMRHSSLGFEMTIDATHRYSENGLWRTVELLRSVDGSFEERYESTATRVR